jgi:hypothetical protein
MGRKGEAVFEFKYLTNCWMVEGASKYGGAPGGRKDVAADVQKAHQRYIAPGLLASPT